MNRRTAKLIKKVVLASRGETKEKELKRTWNETPRPERRAFRAFLRSSIAAVFLVILLSVGGCCQPQVVGEREMSGLIESQAELFDLLEKFIDGNPPDLSEAEKTIWKGEIQAVEEASAKYLKLIQGDSELADGR